MLLILAQWICMYFLSGHITKLFFSTQKAYMNINKATELSFQKVWLCNSLKKTKNRKYVLLRIVFFS